MHHHRHARRKLRRQGLIGIDRDPYAEALGDRRRTFAWLEEAVEDRAGEVVYLDRDPRLDRLRGDRRFARIRGSVGLP